MVDVQRMREKTPELGVSAMAIYSFDEGGPNPGKGNLFEDYGDFLDPLEDGDLVEIKDIIVKEKGEEHYNELVEQRKKNEELKRQREEKEKEIAMARFIGKAKTGSTLEREKERQKMKALKKELGTAAQKIQEISVQMCGLNSLKTKTPQKTVKNVIDSFANQLISFNGMKKFMTWFHKTQIEGHETKEEEPMKEQGPHIQRDMS